MKHEQGGFINYCFQSLRHKNFEFEPLSFTILIPEYELLYDSQLLFCPV